MTLRQPVTFVLWLFNIITASQKRNFATKAETFRCRYAKQESKRAVEVAKYSVQHFSFFSDLANQDRCESASTHSRNIY